MTEHQPLIETVENASAAVRATMQTRDVDMHVVFDHELDSLGTSTTGVPLTFFGAAVGAALTCGGVLTQPLDNDAHGVFVALTVTGAVLATFFGITAISRWRSRQKIIKKIGKRPVAEMTNATHASLP